LTRCVGTAELINHMFASGNPQPLIMVMTWMVTGAC